MFCFVARRFKA